MESRGEDDAGLELPEVTTERSSLIVPTKFLELNFILFMPIPECFTVASGQNYMI